MREDPAAARSLIEVAIQSITLAEEAIGVGEFQSGVRPADALTELARAKDLDQPAGARRDRQRRPVEG